MTDFIKNIYHIVPLSPINQPTFERKVNIYHTGNVKCYEHLLFKHTYIRHKENVTSDLNSSYASYVLLSKYHRSHNGNYMYISIHSQARPGYLSNKTEKAACTTTV